MGEKKYRYNGEEYTESELRTHYGDAYDEKISSGVFEVIEEDNNQNIYVYENTDYTEDELRSHYGDSFDEKISSGLFKKKENEEVVSSEGTTKDSANPQGLSLENGEDILNEQEKSYLVNGKKVDRTTLKDNLFNKDFVDSLQRGSINVTIENDKELTDLFQRQVESGTEFGDKWDMLQSGAFTIASGVMGVRNYIANVMEEVTGVEFSKQPDNIISKAASEKLAKLAEEKVLETRQYKEGFVNSISNGNYADAANIGFNSLTQSAPISVMAAFSGGIAPAAVTLSSLLTSAEYASENISEDENIKNLSNGEKLGRALAYGSAEGFGEAVTGGLVGRNFSVFKDGLKGLVREAAKDGGKEAGIKVAGELGKKTALEIGKTFGIDLAQEGGSEVLTQLAQDATDDIMGVRDLTLNNYLENAKEAFGLGVFMGGVLSSPARVVEITSNSVDALRSNNAVNKSKEIVDNEISSGNISSEEGSKIINDVTSTKRAVDAVDKDLSPEAQVEATKLIKERDNLKKEVESLEAVSPEKRDRLNKLDEEIKNVGEKKVDEVSEGDDISYDIEGAILEGKVKEDLGSEFLIETPVGTDVIIDKSIAKKKEQKSISKPINKPARKSVSVESETVGLTNKEVVKQGVEELITSIKSKSRDKLEKVSKTLKDKISKEQNKFKEFKDRKKAIIDFSISLVDQLNKSGVKNIPTRKVRSIINKLNASTTNAALHNASQKLIDTYQGIAITEEEISSRNKLNKSIKKVKSKSSKAGYGSKFSSPIYNLVNIDKSDIPIESQSQYESVINKIASEDFTDISEITKEVFDILSKYEPEIIENESKKSNPGDVKDLIDELKGRKVSVPEGIKLNKEEKDILDAINSITEDDLNLMSESKLKILRSSMDNIEKGIVSTSSQKTKESIEANRQTNKLYDAINRVDNKNSLKKFFMNPLGFLSKKKTAVGSASSNTIDSMLGLKGRAFTDFLYNFEKAFGEYSYQTKINRASVGKLYDDIGSSKREKRRIADTKVMMYASAKQNEANPNSSITHSVKELYDVSIGNDASDYKNKVGEDAAKIVTELYNKYKDSDGEVSSEDIWSDMSKEEKAIYNGMRKKLDSEVDKVLKIKSLDRAEVFNAIQSYFSYPSLNVKDLTPEQNLDEIQKGVMATKAGVIKDRGNKASPIIFSASKSFLNSIDQVNKDYLLGEPLRVEMKALDGLKARFKGTDMSEIVTEIVGSIKKQRALVLDSSNQSGTSKLVNEIQAGVYKYLLGSLRRALVEGGTNTLRLGIRAISKAVIDGETPDFKAIFSTSKETVDGVINELGSVHKVRLLEGSKFGGYADAFVDSSKDYDLDFSDRSNEEKVANFLKKAGTVNTMISKLGIGGVDKFYSRGLIIAELKKNFKSITNKELDLEKVASGDKSYLESNKDALKESMKKADSEVTDWFSTMNKSQKPLKQLEALNEKGVFATLARIKYFMLPFLLNEGQTLQKAIINKGVKGAIQKGIPIAVGVASYQALMESVNLAFAKAISQAAGDEDESEIGKKLLEDKALQRGMASAILELTIARHFNGVGRIPLNYIIEVANENFGDKIGLREEGSEYDKFKAIAYNRIDSDKGMEATDVIAIVAPEFSPLISGISDINKSVKNSSSEKKKISVKYLEKEKQKSEKKQYYAIKGFLTELSALGILPRDLRDVYVYYKNRDLILNGDKKKK